MAEARGRCRPGMAVAVTLLVTVTASCRGREAATSQPPATLRIGLGQVSQNPATGLRQLSANLSLEALARTAEDGHMLPFLAEKWTTSSDGRQLTIDLRPNVKFHDGSPFDATAVAAILPETLNAFMGPKLFQGVTVKPSGPHSIQISFHQAPAFMVEALEAQIRKPGPTLISTGPYVVAPDSTSELRAFKDYYLGPPTIDRLTIQSYPSVRAAWAEMLRDRIDMLYDVGRDALDSMATATNVSVFTFTRKYQYLIAFNAQSPVLKSRKVRQALNRAIDPTAVIRSALNGQGLRSHGPFWMQHWAVRSDVPWFQYDPEAAAGELSALKVQFKLLVPPDAVYERIALEVKRQLDSVGVIVTVEQLSVDRLFDAIKARAFDAVLMEGVSGPTLFRPFQYWHSEGVMNPGSLGNSTVDAALDRLRTAASDDEFKAAAAVVQQAFVDDPPAIFLAWPQVARAVSKRFNVATDPNRPDVMGTMRLWTPAAAERHASRN